MMEEPLHTPRRCCDEDACNSHGVGGLATSLDVSMRSSSASSKDAYFGIFMGPDDDVAKPYAYALQHVNVRNTFVQFEPERNPSLEAFFEERRIQSSPACPLPSFPSLDAYREGCSTPPLYVTATPEPTTPREAYDADDWPDVADMAEELPSFVPTFAIPGASSASGHESNFTSADRDAPPPPPTSSPVPKTLNDYRTFGEAVLRMTGTAACIPKRQPPLPPGPIQSCGAPCPSTYPQAPARGNIAPGIAHFDSAPTSPLPAKQMDTAAHPEAACSEVIATESSHVILQLDAAIPAMPGTTSPPMIRLTDGEMVAAPTKGSLLHEFGACKPCLFVHTKGCENGFDCSFCHLCQPGEKKRRRKEKSEARRFVKEIREERELFQVQHAMAVLRSIPDAATLKVSVFNEEGDSRSVANWPCTAPQCMYYTAGI